MTDQMEATQERRSANQEVIEHLLKERDQLFSLLLQVSSEDMDGDALGSSSDLEEFIQVLVDYIAAGHFGLYQRIAEGNERRKAVSELAVTIYPQIEQTTAIALAFDEKYNSENEHKNVEHLQSDLSKLCEALSSRIELEDQLINQISSKSEAS